jgi:sugar (pentulose or hexulose) kinase
VNKIEGLFLGIELGSTRIKSVLIGTRYEPVAAGSFTWENKLRNGYWTYDLDYVWRGLQASFEDLVENALSKSISLEKIDAIGISAMMHGYLALDVEGKLLTPFRTWRNTTTGQAAEQLTDEFKFNIPLRWSIAHLYQAILDNEDHVPHIAYLTTLAGYVHWKLTGQKVLGIGDVSGMFPIDSSTNTYNMDMVRRFEELSSDYDWKLTDILPKVLVAGQPAGNLTAEGAKLLDPNGILQPGIPFSPPEGDAGTGMTATNSVSVRTGNVSAGTSVFAMVVLEKSLTKVYPEIDMVTTPTGKPVAMVHCNNCTSDLDAWIKLFGESAALLGAKFGNEALFGSLYSTALKGDADCGGLLSYNYLSGEPITGFDKGRPLVTRRPESNFTLANFMRSLVFSCIAALKLGMDILKKEDVEIDQIQGHGGFFKTPSVGQTLMSAALDTKVSVMDSAGEGGAWGVSLLAAYLHYVRNMNTSSQIQTLEQFLTERVFHDKAISVVSPNPEDVRGFEKYISRYIKGLAIEKAAVKEF